jgi:hypothetical protein
MSPSTNDLSQTPGVALKTSGSLFRPRDSEPSTPVRPSETFMRKPNGRLGPFVLVAASAAVLTGCKEEFSDESFGVLDLASTYDGGTTANPAAGVPDLINLRLGFVEDAQAHYYDFGSVPVKRDPLTSIPQAALVQPMYFFFNPAGAPLFSTAVRELRNGTDWMRGGREVKDPNPKDPKQKKPVYALRARALLIDKNRNSADYQRPIVDVHPGDRNTAVNHHSGLWEIVEVTVPDDYVPDSIKHRATLDRMIGAGKASKRATGKVINCPMIDDRSEVVPAVTSPLIPRPRIELWYRRQLAFCYLANGWETLGNESRELFFANSDAERVDTFDVTRLIVGEGPARSTQILVPLSRAYVPVVLTDDQSGAAPRLTRIADNLLTKGLPRHFRNDPPGYSPIRWMFDFVVDRDYESGGLQSVGQVDPAITGTQRLVRNIPLRGTLTRCGHPMIETRKQCGVLVDNPDDPTGPKLTDATKDPVCTGLGLECNPDSCFCDAPFVGFGQKCGPGVAQCNPAGDEFSPKGYNCVFPTGGYCLMKCAAGEANELMAMNKDKKDTEILDSRCKGVPGYVCYPYLGGTCLKLCDSNVTTGNQCAAQLEVDGMTKDVHEGQTCQDFGLEICYWPEGYEP